MRFEWTRIDRYLLRSVLGGTLAVLGVVLALAAVLLLIDEADKIEGAYSTGKALLFVLLMLPGYMLEFFPLASLIGSLVVLGQLAANNELTAMRSMGLSLARLARPVLLAGLALGLLGMLLGETLGPWGQGEARLMRAQALGQTLSVHGSEGLWVREKRADGGGERFMHIALVTPNGEVREVKVFDFDAHGALSDAWKVAEARPEDGAWRAQQLVSTHFAADSVHSSAQAEASIAQLVQPNVLNVLAVMPQYMSVQELWRYAHFLDANSLKSETYWLALWSKLFAPLAVIAMLLLALPFSLVTRRSGGAGVRLVLGIVLGMAMYVLARILTQGSLLLGLPPLYAALLPPAVMMIAAFVFLRQQEARHAA